MSVRNYNICFCCCCCCSKISRIEWKSKKRNETREKRRKGELKKEKMDLSGLCLSSAARGVEALGDESGTGAASRAEDTE